MTEALVPVDELEAAARATARRIFEGGFPERLRAPWEEVSSDRRTDETSLVLVRDADPVAFVLLRAMGARAIYLRYLVVDESRRGQGIGSAAWQHLIDHCRDAGYAVLVWDVEHPDEEGIDQDERTIRLRRVRFYERLDGVALPVPDYTNPHEDGSGTHESPMVLMAAAMDGSRVAADDAAWVAALVRDVNRFRWER